MKLTKEQIVNINGIRLKSINRYLIETGINNRINEMHNFIQHISNDDAIHIASDRTSDILGYVTNKIIGDVVWD